MQLPRKYKCRASALCVWGVAWGRGDHHKRGRNPPDRGDETENKKWRTHSSPVFAARPSRRLRCFPVVRVPVLNSGKIKDVPHCTFDARTLCPTSSSSHHSKHVLIRSATCYESSSRILLANSCPLHTQTEVAVHKTPEMSEIARCLMWSRRGQAAGGTGTTSPNDMALGT